MVLTQSSQTDVYFDGGRGGGRGDRLRRIKAGGNLKRSLKYGSPLGRLHDLASSTLCQATSHKQQISTTRRAYIAVKQADRPAKTDGSMRSPQPSLLLTLAALHILGAHAGQQFLIQRVDEKSDSRSQLLSSTPFPRTLSFWA